MEDDKIARIVQNAKPKNLAKLLQRCEFEAANNPFRGAFDNEFWEYVVLDHYKSLQKTGKPLQEIDRYYDTKGMIKAGFLFRTETGYNLTEKAIEITRPFLERMQRRN